MRRVLLASLWLFALISFLLGGTLLRAAENNGKTFEYSVAVWGDFPYSDLQATTGVPNLIADINSSDVEFSVHDGDLKAGNATPGSTTPTSCDNALYAQALKYLNTFTKPAMFTPGDNDWTDCDRPSNGGFNSLERLDYERALFFTSPNSFGSHPIQLEAQSTPMCPGFSGPTRCVENRRWTFKGITYFTINVQGSCNNLCDTNPDPDEWAGRNAADIAWLKQSFAAAKDRKSVGIVIITQADPGFDNSDATRAPVRDPKTLAQTDKDPDGFQDYLLALRDETVAFRKPVVYVHGDSHYFRIDRPLQDAKGQRLENFTRLETFGDNQGNGNNDVHWVKILVDTASRDVFAFQPQIVPANRIAVPNP